MNEPNDIEALRAQLDGTRGQEYWRSLEALSGTPEFKEFLHREFPQNASEWLDPVGRRGFLKLMSASLALAGVSACTRQPTEELVPYVRQPEELVPGKPLFYATAMPFAGAGHRPAGREPRRPADEDRRQPRSPVEPRRHRPLRAGLDPRPLRSGSLADDHQPRRDPSVQRLRRRDAQRARRAAVEEGRGPPHPHRDRGVADAGGADRRDPARACPQAKWVQWEPFGRPQRPRGQPAGVRRVRGAAVRASRRPTSSCRSTPTSCAPAPPGLRHARAFASRRRAESTAAAQPALRRREHADQQRHARRSPPAAQGVRDRRRSRARWPRSSAWPASPPARCPPSRHAVARRRSRRTCRPRSGRSLVIAGDGAAAVGARARARDERGARQRRRDGHLHADGRGAARRTSSPACASWSAT